jgi:hypothetical protein
MLFRRTSKLTGEIESNRTSTFYNDIDLIEDIHLDGSNSFALFHTPTETCCWFDYRPNGEEIRTFMRYCQTIDDLPKK